MSVYLCGKCHHVFTYLVQVYKNFVHAFCPLCKLVCPCVRYADLQLRTHLCKSLATAYRLNLMPESVTLPQACLKFGPYFQHVLHVSVHVLLGPFS